MWPILAEKRQLWLRHEMDFRSALLFCVCEKKHGLPTKSQRKGPVMQGFDGYHLEQTVECPVLTSMRDSYNTYYVRDIGSQQLR